MFSLSLLAGRGKACRGDGWTRDGLHGQRSDVMDGLSDGGRWVRTTGGNPWNVVVVCLGVSLSCHPVAIPTGPLFVTPSGRGLMG